MMYTKKYLVPIKNITWYSASLSPAPETQLRHGTRRPRARGGEASAWRTSSLVYSLAPEEVSSGAVSDCVSTSIVKIFLK